MKSRISHNLFVLGAATLALASLAARPAHAAPSAGVPVFASVDINKIQSQSTKKAKYDADLHALADRLDYAFKQQAASIMLTPEDQNELGTLLAKANPTEGDRTRIAALQTQAANAAKQYTDLQQKQNPTPADTSPNRHAGQSVQGGPGRPPEDQRPVPEPVEDAQREGRDGVHGGRQGGHRRRRQAAGITVVFDSSVAVYTSNDITDEVVKRINK